MDEIPMIEPPGGDCDDSCFAPAWMVWNAPVRFVVRVEFQRSGVILEMAWLAVVIQGRLYGSIRTLGTL